MNSTLSGNGEPKSEHASGLEPDRLDGPLLRPTGDAEPDRGACRAAEAEREDPPGRGDERVPLHRVELRLGEGQLMPGDAVGRGPRLTPRRLEQRQTARTKGAFGQRGRCDTLADIEQAFYSSAFCDHQKQQGRHREETSRVLSRAAMSVLTDAQIDTLVQEPKSLPADWVMRLRPKTGKIGHNVRDLDVRGEHDSGG